MQGCDFKFKEKNIGVLYMSGEAGGRGYLEIRDPCKVRAKADPVLSHIPPPRGLPNVKTSVEQVLSFD